MNNRIDIVTANEAAQLMGVKESTFKRHYSPLIKGARFGRSKKFLKSDVEAFYLSQFKIQGKNATQR